MADTIFRLFEPADAPCLVARHQALYARDEGFDATLGPLVASILDDFVLGHDPARERGWIAEAGGARLGSIFCVAQSDRVAKLRLFLLEPEARGRSLGKRLLRTCMGFARAAGYDEMVLWTHVSHRAACALYAAHGWDLVSSQPVNSFGVDLIEQAWRVDLSAGPWPDIPLA